MRKVFVYVFLITLLFSNQTPATKDDINTLRNEMKMMFNQIDKRFEQIDKRFDLMQKQMDKRFDMMQRNMEIRFNLMQKNMDVKLKLMRKNMDERLKEMSKRFDLIANILIALVTGIFGLIGFMMWDRRTVLEKAKKECDIKADKDYVENLAKAIKEVLLQDEYARDIFRKYHLL